MRSRSKRAVGVVFGVLLGAMVLAACVGDAPPEPLIQGADSSADSALVDQSAGDAAPRDSSTTDAVVDAGDPFDGANPQCNGFEPTQAPAQTTADCVTIGPAPPSPAGGAITPGRYYLESQTLYESTSCSATGGPDHTPYYQYLEIAMTDGSGTQFDVQVARDGLGAARFTLHWSVDTVKGVITQTDICPVDTIVSKASYSSTVPSAGLHEIKFVLNLSTFVFRSF